MDKEVDQKLSTTSSIKENISNDSLQATCNEPLNKLHKQNTVIKDLSEYYKNNNHYNNSLLSISTPSSCEALIKDILQHHINITPPKGFNVRSSSLQSLEGNETRVLNVNKNSTASVLNLNETENKEKHKFDLLSTLKKGLGIKTFRDENIAFTHNDLININFPRLNTSQYDNFRTNINHLIKILESKYKFTTIQVQLDLLQHLKELDNILDATVETQVVLLHLNKNDIKNINELIKQYPITTSVSVNNKFHKDLFLYLTSNYKELGLNYDHLKEFYIFNDYNYLNNNMLGNVLQSSQHNSVQVPQDYIYSKILFELSYCNNQIKLLRNNCILIEKNKIKLIRLCDLYQNHYSQIISKFNTDLKFYDKLTQDNIKSLKHSREINFISELINRYKY